MRIDAHIHYTPPSLRDNLQAFVAQEPYWELLLDPQTSIQGWATAERMLADMDEAGIDQVVIMGEYRMQHETSVARNTQALELLRRWPDRISAFACVQPRTGEKAIDELKRCLDGGMVGVGESNPYGQGHTFTDPGFLQLVEYCIEVDIPLNLHVNEEVGHYYPGKTNTPLRRYYWLAKTYPALKLILAHWGGGLFFYELMSEVREVLRNVWYDTAASPLLYPTARIFDVALRCIDHGKILYGSDYPLRIYPRRQQEPDFTTFIDEIEGLGLEPAIMKDIMGRNAARLLGLMEDEESTEKRPIFTPETSSTGSDAASHIDGSMSVTLVAQAWPATQAIFDRYGIPYRDNPVPDWEPIRQAAAARGYDAAHQQRLLDDLNEIVAS